MLRVSKDRAIFIFVVSLVTTMVITAGAEDPPAEGITSTTCPKITCTKPPEGLSCNKTVVKSPVLLKRIGKLKECCSAWRCQEEDGSFSTYFGMSGAEVPGGNSTGSPGNSSDDKGPIKVPEDKCAEARTICPTPDGADSCVVSTSTEAMTFKPKGELDSCCPTYNCTQPNGAFHLHYIMSGGKLPTSPAALEKEKGTPEGTNKCPKVSCAPEPPMTSEGPKCSAATDIDSSRIKALGGLRECCEVWKCSYEDGAFYTHFELQSPSFWIAETSFHSEAVPGDEVAEVTEPTASEASATPVPKASKSKANPKPTKSPKLNNKGKGKSVPKPKPKTTEAPDEVPTTEAEEEATTPVPVPLSEIVKSKKKPIGKKGTKTSSSNVKAQILPGGIMVGNTKSSSSSYATHSNSETSWSTNGNPNPPMQAPAPGNEQPQPRQMSPAEQQVMMMQQQQAQQMGRGGPPLMGPPPMMMGPPMMGPPMMYGPPMMGPPMYG